MGKNKTIWKIEDFIDLEYFLHHENSFQDEKRCQERDRQDRSIFLEHIKPHMDSSGNSERTDRSFIIKNWLACKRSVEKENMGEGALLPGELFSQGYTLILYIFAMIAIASGFGGVLSFLTYKGYEPINVSSYIGIFVFPQLILLIFLFAYLALFKKIKILSQFSVIRLLIRLFLLKTVYFIKKNTFRNMPSEEKIRIESAFGVIKGKSKIYGHLFPWPVFILSQVFGVFFNIGALSATLLRVVGSDLAFGWQSTLKLSADAVYKAVSIISVPWSWAVGEPISHPTLSQVEGSRMVLKDGISSLVTYDLVSWWPFLCFVLLFYALAPRICFLWGGLFVRRSLLNRIDFQQIIFDKLLLRMTTPILDTEGEVQESPAKKPFHGSIVEGRGEPEIQVLEESSITGEDLMVFIPEDIYDRVRGDELERHVKKTLGKGVSRKIRVALDFFEDEGVITSNISHGDQSLLIVMEAWQPPIKETIYYFEDIRKAVGPGVRIYIVLIGKPSDETIFTPSNDEDTFVWKTKINSLADPNIRVEILV